MKKFKGEIVRKGNVKGKALVSEKPISFLGGINPENGKITEKNHPLNGKSIKDKILVFPHGKGSTVGSYVLYQLKLNQKSPKAIINQEAEPIVATGAIIAEIPMLHKFNKDPIKNIKTGDTVIIKDQNITVKK